MEREPTDRRDRQVAEHFVVELADGDQRRYVLCQRILIIGDDDTDDLPPELLDQLFERKPLRAVALPTARGGRWLQRGGGWPQSGRNVNININLLPDP